MPYAPLSHFAHNTYSQYGEDGIVKEILSRLSLVTALDKWCVEFGAWDGMHLSNTYRLIKEEDYSAVLIEGDAKRHAQLCLNIPKDNVIKVCQFVTLEGSSTLDAILAKTPIQKNFDFLSIDIDGCDFYILQSLKVFRPKVICIEYNPSIPNEVNFIQEPSFTIKHGASAQSLSELASRMDYQLVAVTNTNLIFVDRSFAQHVVGTDFPTLESLRDDSAMKCFIFVGYDGTILSNQKTLLLRWHGVEVPIADHQVLPSWLRKYFGDYTVFDQLLLVGWQLFTQPRAGLNRIKRRLSR